MNTIDDSSGQGIHTDKSFSRSRELYARACALLPAGVNSPVRAFKAVGGTPIFFKQAKGSVLTDVDGNRYIDYVGSWGPMIMGHSHPEVVEAVRSVAGSCMSFGAPHEGEILLAEAVLQAMPNIELLRFVNSGTEATMSALRLARGATDRPLIVKFEGCYHGHVDYMLVKAGSGMATFSLPDSAGVPDDIARTTLTLPLNDLSAVESLFEKYGTQIAALIIEPVVGNMGVIPPEPGFLNGLKAITEQHSALFVLDEVMTGFRVSHGGACALYDVKPDLVCLGKVIGGGLPVGAYGGRRDIMEHIAPLGPVYQAGTLSGNPLAMAAGLATLKLLTPDAYDHLEKVSRMLQTGLQNSLQNAKVSGVVQRVGSMLSVFFTEEEVRDAGNAAATDRDLYVRVFHRMLEAGVYLPPSPLEAWFISAAHTEQQICQTIEIFEEALQGAKQV